MRLLFLTPYLPGPPLFGGARRIHGLVNQLARSHEVSMLALVDGSAEQRAGIADAKTYCRRVETVGDRRHQVSGRSKRLLQLGSLLSASSWERWLYLRPAFQGALHDHLAQHVYDAVICEFVFMAGYRFRGTRSAGPPPRLVLDEHNVEYDLLRRTAATSRLGRRVFHELNWRKLKREEIAIWRRFDACTLTSRRDEEFVRREAPALRTAVVPNGVDVESFCPRPNVDAAPLTLLFFGAINYYPNTDGALHFANQVLPLLRAREPFLRVRVVGPIEPGTAAELRKAGIEVVGFVDDVKAEIARATVVIVPLRIGGGTRLKILEAMAMAKPIVSTRIGAEGIDVQHDTNILLADTPEEFSREVSRVLHDVALRERLGAAARRTAMERYSWRAAAETMAGMLRELANESVALGR